MELELPSQQGDQNPADADDPTVAAGRQIRTLRQRRELSMQALAERAEVSRAWLGQIERGSASPSVDIVRRLANALQVPVGALLDSQSFEAPSPHPAMETCVIRRSKRLTLHFPSQPFAWEMMTPLSAKLQMMTADVGPSDDAIELMSHSGQESVLCLRGQLNVIVQGDEVVLHEGDCITFSARLPHGYANRGTSIARLLNVTVPPSIGQIGR
jgi:transcriptional regulator with XRE-family HTH domain